MMIEVFVHDDGPLLRFEWTKEWMGMPGAARCAFPGEAIDRCDEIAAFSLEIATSGVGGKKFRHRRGVAAHGLVIAEDQRLDEQAENAGREWRTFGIDSPHRHFQASIAVRQGLGDVHLAPLTLTVWMKLQDALLCLCRQSGVKEVFRGSRFGDVTVVGHGYTFLSRGERLQMVGLMR
jgi:hypothetical protein